MFSDNFASYKEQKRRTELVYVGTDDRDLSFNNLCTMLGDIAAELIIQPHQAITSGGGGGTNSEQGWRDDKDKDNPRNEPFYKPSKRRR